ncbi:MAG TPA: helix-turn-helix domain-containing protein [Flavobacterium sp.]|nr:helix-turn-helix domain-containing protein [Flavobacterium sp.]
MINFYLSKQMNIFVLSKVGRCLHLIFPRPQGCSNSPNVSPFNLFYDMTAIELLTKEDLKTFKAELLVEIKSMLAPDESPKNKWIRSNQVRKLLNISPGTLQNLRINGTLRFTRIGSIIYYKLEDIDTMLEGGL